jgi:hypothetical protein
VSASGYMTARCTHCNINWPRVDGDGNASAEFSICPSCGRGTVGSTWAWTYESFEDAMSEKKRFLFEAYAQARDAKANEDWELFVREPFAAAQYIMDTAVDPDVVDS